MRAPEHAIPAPPFPGRLQWVNVGAAPDGQAARTAGAGGVLGLLPRELAPHAPVPQGLARALRAGRAARDRDPHRRVPARARDRERGRGRRAARDRVPRRDRRAARAVGLLRQRGLAGAVPVGRRRARSTRSTTARAPTRRPSARSRRCSGVERELLAPLRPEDEEGILLPAQTEDQPGAYSGPYEAGGAWAVLEGDGEVAANGRRIRVTAPGCYPLVEHPHHTEGVLELAVGDGVTCHATCFTPGVAPPAHAAPRGRDRPAGG